MTLALAVAIASALWCASLTVCVVVIARQVRTLRPPDRVRVRLGEHRAGPAAHPEE